MNEDMVKKNIEYQEQVIQIAKMLYHAFFYEDEEEVFHHAPNDAAQIQEQLKVRELTEQAERMFEFFGSAEDAKKTIRFLQTICPEIGKQIIEKL